MLTVPTKAPASKFSVSIAGWLDVAPLDGGLDDLRLLRRQCRRLAGRLRGGSARQRRGRRQRRQKKYVKPTVHSSISSFSSRLVNTT